ncbi:MAG: PilZ domain-containing protein [Coprococcus sp.]|nr:PilZ domain-containing protein [Coprococcus sp.]
MSTMNSSLHTEQGTLYHMDCSLFSSIRYFRDSFDTTVFVFPEKPCFPIPERVFLMPDGSDNDFRSFLFTLSGEILTYQGNDPSDARGPWYYVRGTTDEMPELRTNFRVYVSFRTMVWINEQSQEESITVKDIGTGGFLFVSRKEFTPGSVISAILPDAREPVFIKALIRKRRPVRKDGLFGYGCQFIEMSARAEAKVRQFVFQTELLQSKARAAKPQ